MTGYHKLQKPSSTNVLLVFLVQYSMLATPYKFVTIVIYLVMMIVEAARLYLGYEGNLREKVHSLC